MIFLPNFYLYSQFVLDKTSKSNAAIKELKQKPRFRYIFTSGSTDYAIKSINFSETKPFVFCKTGFDEDLLSICLCNVPLYKTADYKEDFLATEYSGNSIGYISKKDFMNNTNSRVKIIFNNSKQNNRHFERYIDFDDIHYIKSDLYVDETISLAKTNEKTLEIISEIESDVSDKTYKYYEIKKETIFSFFKDKKMKKGLTYVSYAYTKFAKKFIYGFKIHKNQLLTSFEALQTCLFEEKRTSNGVIYQVETG